MPKVVWDAQKDREVRVPIQTLVALGYIALIGVMAMQYS
jgi:hypothetical protein